MRTASCLASDRLMARRKASTWHWHIGKPYLSAHPFDGVELFRWAWVLRNLLFLAGLHRTPAKPTRPIIVAHNLMYRFSQWDLRR